MLHGPSNKPPVLNWWLIIFSRHSNTRRRPQTLRNVTPPPPQPSLLPSCSPRQRNQTSSWCRTPFSCRSSHAHAQLRHEPSWLSEFGVFWRSRSACRLALGLCIQEPDVQFGHDLIIFQGVLLPAAVFLGRSTDWISVLLMMRVTSAFAIRARGFPCSLLQRCVRVGCSVDLHQFLERTLCPDDETTEVATGCEIQEVQAVQVQECF